MINVWRYIPYHATDDPNNKDRALAIAKREGRITIGWGRIGDIQLLRPQSSLDIETHVRAKYQADKLGNYKRGGETLWDLFNTLRPEDLIVGHGHLDKCVFEVTGSYYWDDALYLRYEDEYSHRLHVDLTELDPEKTIARAKLNKAPESDRYKPLLFVGSIQMTSGLSR